MSLVGVVNGPRSKLCRVAAADALLTAAILVLCVIGAFTYEVFSPLGGLIPVFLIGSVPLAVVATMDVLSWRRITATWDPSLLRKSAGEVTNLPAGGIPLLLFGALMTVVGVSAGNPAQRTAFASATRTAVGYLLPAALGTQTALLVLTWVIRRKSAASDSDSAPYVPQKEGVRTDEDRLLGWTVLAVIAGFIALFFFWGGLGVMLRGGWSAGGLVIGLIVIAVGVVCGQASRLAWRRRSRSAAPSAATTKLDRS